MHVTDTMRLDWEEFQAIMHIPDAEVLDGAYSSDEDERIQEQNARTAGVDLNAYEKEDTDDDNDIMFDPSIDLDYQTTESESDSESDDE